MNLAGAGLVPHGSRAFEVGGGTGYFASHAARHRSATVVCSERDGPTRTWAEVNRRHPSVTYCSLTLEEARKEAFDVAVAIDVDLWTIPEHARQIGEFVAGAPLAPILAPAGMWEFEEPLVALCRTPLELR